MKYRPPNPLRSGGRAHAEMLARSLAGCVVSPHWPYGPWTSAERRWSQIMHVKMRRRTPHPRPWEGPVVNFAGIFLGVDRDRKSEAAWSSVGTDFAEFILEIVDRFMIPAADLGKPDHSSAAAIRAHVEMIDGTPRSGR